MTQLKIGFGIAVLLIITACGGSGDDTSNQTTRDRSEHQIEQTESDIPYNFRLEMEMLLSHYFELKDAVVSNDSEQAKQNAEELASFTREVLDDMLGAENRGLWLGIARILRTESDKLVATDSVAEMRIYFEHISRSMIRIADSFDPVGGPYYLMECESAATGENQWLSNEQEVQNPYQTSADVNCGEIIEEM
jgi:Cu(I)/Ag(I) efflux system membrane fusion protein